MRLTGFREEALPPIRDADELHELLISLVALGERNLSHVRLTGGGTGRAGTCGAGADGRGRSLVCGGAFTVDPVARSRMQQLNRRLMFRHRR